VDSRPIYLLLAAMLCAYLTAIARMVSGAWARRATPEELIVGLVALYGMATLQLYIGRSDANVLLCVTVPFCLVATSFVVDFHRWLAQQHCARGAQERHPALSSILEFMPIVFAASAAVALLVNAHFREYPGLLQVGMGNRWGGNVTSSGNYLFARTHDAPMPELRRDAVQRFHAIAQRVRELAQDGQGTLAVIDMADTAYLVEADVRPYFRYSPVLASLGTKRQVAEILDVLRNSPPDWVLLPSESPVTLFGVRADDVYEEVRTAVQARFDREQELLGTDVYRRRK
jgi:hypothetical protein